jgi:hypothetical protein
MPTINEDSALAATAFEQEVEGDHEDRDGDPHPDRLVRDEEVRKPVRDDVDLVVEMPGERRRDRRLRLSSPDRCRAAVEDEEQAEREDHRSQHAATLERLDEHSFDERAHHHRPDHDEHDRQPDVPAALDRQGVDDERGEHGHLALGEVEVAGRLVDHHHSEGHQRVHRAVGQCIRQVLQEQREREEVALDPWYSEHGAHPNSS